MATHSCILAWKMPWTVLSMGLQSPTGLSDFHFHHSSLCRCLDELIWGESRHCGGRFWKRNSHLHSFHESAILINVIQFNHHLLTGVKLCVSVEEGGTPMNVSLGGGVRDV